MSDRDSKRYYWLKLKKDFFQRHDIRIIESMPNGKDYVLFYLKLMCESTSHEGELRFNEYIPYSAEMLATITNTSIDTVHQAIKLFEELKMLEVLDDGTIYLNTVEKLIGSELGSAERQREHRKKLKCDNVTNVSHKCHLEIELEKDKEIEKEIDKKKNRFAPPTYEEVDAYCKERENNIDANRFIDFYSSKGWMVGKNKMKDWKACIRTWEQKEKPKQVEHGEKYEMNLGDCRGDYW